MNSFDLVIMSFINRMGHRSPTFDEFVLLLSANTLLKGGVVVAVIWWLWFRREDAYETRQTLAAGVFASFLGLVVARILTHLIFRVRPLNSPHLAVPFPCELGREAWEGASSFPSDHAVLFFALATGIFFASHRVGWWMFAYVSTVICLPSVYLGIHYPTDVLAGAAIGVGLAWLFDLPAIRGPATNGGRYDGWIQSRRCFIPAFFC